MNQPTITRGGAISLDHLYVLQTTRTIRKLSRESGDQVGGFSAEGIVFDLDFDEPTSQLWISMVASGTSSYNKLILMATMGFYYKALRHLKTTSSFMAWQVTKKNRLLWVLMYDYGETPNVRPDATFLYAFDLNSLSWDLSRTVNLTSRFWQDTTPSLDNSIAFIDGTIYLCHASNPRSAGRRNIVAIYRQGDDPALSSSFISYRPVIDTLGGITRQRTIGGIDANDDSSLWYFEEQPFAFPDAAQVNLRSYDWLSIEADNTIATNSDAIGGNISPLAPQEFRIRINPALLEPGTYEALIAVWSDDPASPYKNIQVSVSVRSEGNRRVIMHNLGPEWRWEIDRGDNGIIDTENDTIQFESLDPVFDYQLYLVPTNPG